MHAGDAAANGDAYFTPPSGLACHFGIRDAALGSFTIRVNRLSIA